MDGSGTTPSVRLIRPCIGVVKHQVTKDAISCLMINEIKMTLAEKNIDYDDWKADPNHEQVELGVSFDVGWQR